MNATLKSRFHVIIVMGPPSPWLEACLGAALAQTHPAERVTLFERLPGVVPEDIAERFPGVVVMRAPGAVIGKPETHLSLASAYNRAAGAVRDADYLLLLEPESILSITYLEHLAHAFRQNLHMGVLGGKVLSADVETIQEMGAFLAGNGLPRPIQNGKRDTGQFQGVRHALCAPVAALAVRTGVWCELGGFDEHVGSPQFQKTDFCFRAQQHNWRIGVACEATATYFGELIGADAPRAWLENYFQGRISFLSKHYNREDWMKRFWPAELRWLASRESRGQRIIALRMLARGFKNGRERRAAAPQSPPPDFKL